MEIKPTRYAPNRQAKKLRRWLLFVILFSVVLLCVGGYKVVNFDKNTDTSKKATSIPSSETLPPPPAPTEEIKQALQLTWPRVGQAAIGSVEAGLLARSSDTEEQRPTASMAKVITALAVIEKQPFELGQAGQSYTLTAKDVANYRAHLAKGGSVLPVYEGLILTQYQALQAMLIGSANNIADMLIERTFGSTDAYRLYAQDMLQRMGLNRTVVADASGFSSATISTPSELVIIGIIALKKPVIANIVAQPQARLPGVGTIKNTNDLLSTDGIFGIKTGTTHEAGSCLLFAARYAADDGQEGTVVGVIMGSTNISLLGDVRKLLASAKQGLSVVEPLPATTVVVPSSKQRNQAPQQ